MDDGRLGNREYYDQFAARYEKGRDRGYHKLLDDLETDLILGHAKGKDVLEVGCGTGLILRRIDPVARKAVGIDMSPGMLELARQRSLRVEVASATDLPFDDGSFDLTYSFKVLAHVEQIDTALSEMARVTRPGGRLFLEFYNRHSIRYLIRRLRGGLPIADGIHDNQVYVRFDSPAEMTDRLPGGLRCVALHGVRIFTIAPSTVNMPLVGPALRFLESAGRSGPLARFGGFLVLECQKD